MSEICVPNETEQSEGIGNQELFPDDEPGAITEITNQEDSNETLPESSEVGDSMNNVSIKRELQKIVQDIKERKILPDVVAELIFKKKLNTMNVDLYDYDKGFEISFHKSEEEQEEYHGKFSYGLSVISYIRDGEIPYELMDYLINYKFKIYYDGFVFCHLRIHFEQEESMRSHFVLLRHTIQTIDKECSMKHKDVGSLDFERERARLIHHYSPDLCLDPDPLVAEIVIDNELKGQPFLTPYLKHIIQNKKASREKGVLNMSTTSAKYPKPGPKRTEKDSDWDLDIPTAKEVESAKEVSKLRLQWPVESYLRKRKIYFPDKDSFTGFHVEIENFVYEYDGFTRAKKVESLRNEFCVSVLDEKEYYYGAYRLDERMKDYVNFYWWAIGGREELDIYVNNNSKMEMKNSCGGMKITHNRLFDEQVESVGEEFKIVRQKLELPVSTVILDRPGPPATSGNQKTKTDA